MISEPIPYPSTLIERGGGGGGGGGGGRGCLFGLVV